ncbi:MAG TPA: RHS repeat-associated core domain-containing protein [Candidatus Babeliaceae bacterium]|nr:RHS repeat-associated core domain-containing protein [Candidatus Babeliaceae bacterium]
MSIYTAGDNNIHTGNLSLTEVPMYGSSRLGMTKPTTDGTAAGIDVHSSLLPVGESYNDGMANYTMYHTTFVRGTKLFELSNHLGNVLVTISDKKIGHDAGNGTIDYYTADVLSAQDFYPGGMQMPGRTYTAGNQYRYGFNGKEMDNEVKGIGNEYDYGERIYDPRVVVWLSTDKMQAKHPGESPYLFVGGNPIHFLDPDGKDRIEHVRTIGKDGTVLIKTQITKGLYKAVWNNVYDGVGYATKNDYEVFTTHDLRSGKDVVTMSSRTLYGPDHASEIGILKYAKITGNDGDILPKPPQLLVFGSGTEDPGWGTKADPNRPITVIDFAAFESIMSLVMVGMKVPDLKGADPKKIPELVDKYRKAKIYERDNKVEQCESCKAFKQGGKIIDTTGKGIKPKDIKQVPIEEFHKDE